MGEWVTNAHHDNRVRLLVRGLVKIQCEIPVCCCLTGSAWLCLDISPNHVPEAVRHSCRSWDIGGSRSQYSVELSKAGCTETHATKHAISSQQVYHSYGTFIFLGFLTLLSPSLRNLPSFRGSWAGDGTS